MFRHGDLLDAAAGLFVGAFFARVTFTAGFLTAVGCGLLCG
jgi:hypothetical protein